MIEVLATALTVVALVAAAWSLVLAIANRPITLATKPTLALAGVVVLLEVGLLVQAVAGVVNVLGADRELDRVTFVGYLIGAAVVLPLGAFWSLAERSRWGAGVLTVACLSVPVMILRLNMIWSGHG
jgi:predicted transcriptional regulator